VRSLNQAVALPTLPDRQAGCPQPQVISSSGADSQCGLQYSSSPITVHSQVKCAHGFSSSSSTISIAPFLLYRLQEKYFS
jgi:hypothetical protein